MVKNQNIIWLVAIVALILLGMQVQKNYDVFSILSTGEYRANQDCTFITNLAPTYPYYNSNSWITINGVAYGYYGYSTFSCDNAEATKLSVKTLEGYDICTRAGDNYVGRVYIREDNKGIIFDKNEPEAASAVLSCIPVCKSVCTCASSTCKGTTCSDGCGGTCPGIKTCTVVTNCTSSWTCTSWSQCVNNKQTRTCSDSNLCEPSSSSIKPPTTQTCSESCPTLASLTTQANSWIAGTITFSQLINYANSWATCS